jgi:hypothetical protein
MSQAIPSGVWVTAGLILLGCAIVALIAIGVAWLLSYAD